MHISTYSLKTLADAFVPLMDRGGSFVGLDFDNRQAWPAYNWMGVAKSALQSVNRYLARELGPQQIRCNLVAAGPVRTMAESSFWAGTVASMSETPLRQRSQRPQGSLASPKYPSRDWRRQVVSTSIPSGCWC